MGQVSVPAPTASLILTATDRLVSSNADGGMSPAAAHVVLLGENAGQNLSSLQYLYVIGASSLAGGLVNTADNGSVVYGGRILSALVNTPDSFPQGPDGPFVAIGYNIAPALTSRFHQSTLIGANILRTYPAGGLEPFGDVLIGNNIQEYNRVLNSNGGTNAFNVMIGYNVARHDTTLTLPGAGATLGGNVLIGSEVMENTGFNSGVPGVVIFNNIFIGRKVARRLGSAQNATSQANVLIGGEIAQNTVDLNGCVAIGSGISFPASGAVNYTLIGSGIVATTMNNKQSNVGLGVSQSFSGLGNGNMFLGDGANTDSYFPNNSDNNFLVSMNYGAQFRTLIYGKFSSALENSGGLVFGNSNTLTLGRDLPGFNLVKIMDGARDGGLTAPVGGGFFYSKLGTIHWVDTGGNDYDLTTGGTLGAYLVAALPAAPPIYTRAFVTDALAPAFAAAVVGGGAVVTPVYFDGAAWLCG